MNSLLNWATIFLLDKAVGGKKEKELEDNPVFQAAQGVVVPWVVHQAGGDHLTQQINQADQVVQLVQAGVHAAQSGALPDGFPVPTICIGPG